MAHLFPLPPLVWALLWGGAALAMLTAALRPYWRNLPVRANLQG